MQSATARLVPNLEQLKYGENEYVEAERAVLIRQRKERWIYNCLKYYMKEINCTQGLLD